MKYFVLILAMLFAGLLGSALSSYSTQAHGTCWCDKRNGNG